MAASSPAAITDLFGEQYTFWVDGIEVWLSSYISGDEEREEPLGKPPTLAFEQEVEDQPIDAVFGSGYVLIGGQTVGRTGLMVVYMAESGLRKSKISALDGDVGSWQDVIGG